MELIATMVGGYSFTLDTFKKKLVGKVSDNPLLAIDYSRYPLKKGADKNSVYALKCGAKAAYLTAEAFKKIDPRKKEEVDALKKTTAKLWELVMEQINIREDIAFIFDSYMTTCLMSLVEVDKSFIFGEMEHERFLINQLPQGMRLTDCGFSTEHADFENINCVKIKFQTATNLLETPKDILLHIEDCEKIAQYFVSSMLNDATRKLVPANSFFTQRFFSFFSKSRYFTEPRFQRRNITLRWEALL